jgi:hypothetical protein
LNNSDSTQKPKLTPILSSEKRKILNHLHTRYLKNEVGRLELAIIVDEETTLADIEKAWTGVKIRTNQILEIQGTDPNDYYHLSRLRLARLYLVEGFSYTEVAMDANYDTLVNLIQIAHYLNSGDPIRAKEFAGVIGQRLSGLGMKPNDIWLWMQESLEEVKNGRAPWSLDSGPIDKRRIVDLVRQLNREVEKGTIVIKENPPGVKLSSVPAGEIANSNRDYWNTAKKLLAQLPNSGGLPKLEKAHERYLKSLKG